jgi:hypothetical protein
MKKVILIAFLIGASSTLIAQVGIKRKDVSSVSTLLDFPTGATDGIILPAVTNATNVASPVNGTIIFDRSDAVLKYYQNNAWVTLSKAGNAANAPALNPAAEVATTGVVISDMGSNNATGVLELRSNTKAMVLPRVENPHLTIKSPVAGTMVYDITSKCVALFDGAVWNYLVAE